jgi:AcrR family transcriptional regulator
MYSMTESATLNLRERRMQQTAERLTAVSRRLTAQRGLGGFTIEEVCEEVEVSRRTFFNYFASKEDAIIGVDSAEEDEKFIAEFLAHGPGGWGGALQDLVDLVVAHMDAAELDVAGHSDFIQALEREPRLLARFIGVSRERERELAKLVARREGVAEDDPRAEAVVSMLSTLLRSSGERLLAPGNSREFSALLIETLATYRVVFAATTDRKAAS